MHGNSREDWIYFAGLFDGEGSIMVIRNASDSFMKNRLYPHYGICARIGMIDEEIIRDFHRCVKIGTVVVEKSYHRKRHMIRWMCRRVAEIKEFLVKIEPLLRLKRKNAQLALEFIQECSGAYGKRITPEMHTKQHGYYIKMRALNGIESPATTERMGQRGRSKGLRLQATV